MHVALVSAILIAAQVTISENKGNPVDPSSFEFFEKEVRPLLIEQCHGCHGAQQAKAGLRLDSRAAILEGGESGPAAEPGDADGSLLIEAVRGDGFVQMPPKSRLTSPQIAALEQWVAQGLPWPGGDEHRSELPGTTSGFDLELRAKHWSLQPIQAPEPPDVNDNAWPLNSLDHFVLARLESEGLRPAPDTDRLTWLRRVTFDLTGLPPTPEECLEFQQDSSADGFVHAVDRLLASPRYGERWARHWLDLVRYAETAGHEFDYDIPNAWRYRDYVIRALNADVPYDQFVLEHLAGDLLDDPRRDPTTGTNESILGTGFFLLGEGTHSPVDVREDEAARIDNQIDVFSKTFLGLTVACARCHDHKFDAISQRDYYALAGFLRSSRHQHAFLDSPGRHDATVAAIRSLLDEFAKKRPVGVEKPPESPRHAVRNAELFDDFSGPAFENWYSTGDAFGLGPTRDSGAIRLVTDGASPALEIVPPGWAHSGLDSERLNGVLRSRTVTIDRPFLHVLASGRGGRINVVVDGFEKIRDPIYGGLSRAVDHGSEPRWVTIDLRMWQGHRAYIELCDGATVDFQGASSRLLPGDGYLAVGAIWTGDDATPPATADPSPRREPLDPSDPDVAAMIARYQVLEATLDPPTLGLALADGTGEDVPLHVRGSTRNLGDPVPRRFLEAINPSQGSASSSCTDGSGRLDLARHLIDPANPLTARVIVNRLWNHHFGAGIVRTPDDFGQMGQAPSHPELLDFLAAEFIRNGWSLKALHRQIVLSRTYRMASVADPEIAQADPENRLLHRANVRRLDAESVRDAILAVSGQLKNTVGGPSVPTHLTDFMEGRGRPAKSGPLDGDGRRSLYLNVRRNFLPPMLQAFDFPTPSTTIGRRNSSNVAAQALTLLNDPFVLDQARRWAEMILDDPAPTGHEARVDRMFLAAYGRPSQVGERTDILAFLGTSHDPALWAELAHVLFNTKEFLFIR